VESVLESFDHLCAAEGLGRREESERDAGDGCVDARFEDEDPEGDGGNDVGDRRGDTHPLHREDEDHDAGAGGEPAE
jgi:hypothetical protein